MKKTLLVSAVIGMILLVAGCKKDVSPATSGIIGDNATLDEVMADDEMAWLQGLMDEEEQFDDGVVLRGSGPGPDPDSTMLPPCATRTWSGDSLHRVLTIDFGPEPCLCRDGRYRSGKVITHFIGRRHEVGSKRIHTFEQYVVDGHHIGGTRTTTYLGEATFLETVVNGFITFNDTTSTWEAEHRIRIIAGFDTPGHRDDVLRITGGRHGVNRDGIGYTTTITEPLIRVMDPHCAPTFVDGIRRTETEDGHIIILDFDPIGAAPCDRIGRLTIDGESRIILLR